MAIQAQKFFSESFLMSDLCIRNIAAATHLDDQQRQLRLLLDSQTDLGSPHIFSGTGFSTGQQNSELTCNGTSGSRKRGRGFDDSEQHRYNTIQRIHSQIASVDCLYDGRVENSAMPTSTSGRSTCSTDAPGAPDDLISCVYHHSLEVDAFVRLEGERLRSQLEEVSRRHYRALLSVVERQIHRRLLEKESELQRAKKRHAELEEKLTQAATENQVWFNVARNNEAVVTNMRSTLERALIQQKSVEEGFGESGDPGDEASSCFDDVLRPSLNRERSVQPAVCRGCGGEEDVCVLLLPCRHLCLCKSCESKTDTCPICHTARNASIQVVLM